MNLYYKDEYIRLFQGDCLEVMDKLIEKGIEFDAIITDPPYGTTACKWDSIISLEEMWERLNKLIVDNGAICLFGQQPFTSALVMSNPKMFKYEWIWIKNSGADALMAKNKPLSRTENITIFSKGTFGTDSKNRMKYNPQGIVEINKQIQGKNISGNNFCPDRTFKKKEFVQTHTNYPKNILEFKKDGKLHPTQKPVDLLEYLINTYTNENDLILDFTCGSGTTLLASRNLKRKCIGIELEEKYCEIAKQRLEKVG